MSIIFFAPDSDNAAIFRRVLGDHVESVQVVEALLSAAVPIAMHLEEEGAEVFVARGGTAALLREKGIKSPVVEIHVTSEDMVDALAQARHGARSDNPRIALVAFSEMVQDLLDFLPFLKLRITSYTLASEEDADPLVNKAVNDGAQVIIGGAIAVRIAQERGLPAVLLRSGESSIRLALEEAQRIIYARRLEAHRSNELKAMLEYAYEGIIAVNSEGRVTVFNPVAESVTGVRQDEALGRPARNVFPSIRFEEILRSGSQEIGELLDFGHSKVMVNRIPIRAGGEIVGAVATFQDITRIQSMEERIRREIYSQGHVAKFSFGDICGSSRSLMEAIEIARQYARVDSTVLIHGETGVGKELFAQSIHRAGNRRDGPFVAVNCAALPETLLESELFGYVEGAFTGARRKGKPGLFELAHHGTIFLDEVSEIPLSLQGRLLRVLQEREVVRLGHDRVIPVDVRVLCATNRDLHLLVDEGSFRRDLYWRLNVLALTIPPLRERPGDIVPLMNHFLAAFSVPVSKEFELEREAISFLGRYPWPGNVRELRNLCERLNVVHAGKSVDAAVLSRLMAYSEPACAIRTGKTGLKDIESAIAQAGGKVSKAAEILGIHRATLWRKRKRSSLRSKG
ncbi:MAG: sigma-54-dependent Fis family transcriptional regulator [Desulfobacteraceae bacterium]|nr:MAG: sigma-54-dependent Fis family transcriptional regulator [Desulfobacteraceae bacterium]